MKVLVPKMKKLKALSQDRLLLIEMKIPLHLFSECYTLSVIADLAHALRKSLQTTSTSPCRTQVQPAASFLVCFLIFIEYQLAEQGTRKA